MRNRFPTQRIRMYQVLFFAGLVLLACVLSTRLADKLPVPSLIVFIALGMLLGVDGPLHIRFDDYGLTETVCCIALLFIMFYGGFNANAREARPVAAQAVLLSTAGVVLTCGLVGAFAHYVLGTGWVEGLLIGSVIASTDAASVFSVLRGERLSLKDGTASLLEVESGSNDPISYMLTVIFASLLAGQQVDVPHIVAAEIAFGLAGGIGIGAAAVWALRRADFGAGHGQTIFLVAVAIIAYAGPQVVGGNGFLSVYLAGMVVGNSKIPSKRAMVRFLETLDEIAQMVIFFMLGLLVTPSHLLDVVPAAAGLFAFLTFVGRPVSVFALLAPFRSSPGRNALVSWAGLRGAASVVFAIVAVMIGAPTTYPLFDLVFVVVLISLVLQGSLLPGAARRFGMIDEDADVMKTFNDFEAENDLSFVQVRVGAGHPFAGKRLREISTLRELLVVLILREEDADAPAPEGEEEASAMEPRGEVPFRHKSYSKVSGRGRRRRAVLRLLGLGGAAGSAGPAPERRVRQLRTIIPGGNTLIEPGDVLVFAAEGYDGSGGVQLREVEVGKGHRWAGKLVMELPERDRMVMVMVRRGDETIIPRGQTRIQAGDVAVVAEL